MKPLLHPVRSVAGACAALLLLAAPGALAQGVSELDLDLEPGLEHAPPAPPAPRPVAALVQPGADEPWLAPGQDEPSGGLSSYVRLPPGEVLSPTVALLLPVTLTLVPVITGAALFAADDEDVRHAGFAVMNAGILLGPSAGHFYVGETRHGLITLGIRAALVGGSFAMYGAALSSRPDRPNNSFDDDTSSILGMLAFTLAIGAFGVGIYDFIDAPRAANRANARTLISSVAVAPTVIRTGRENRLGLVIAARF